LAFENNSIVIPNSFHILYAHNNVLFALFLTTEINCNYYNAKILSLVCLVIFSVSGRLHFGHITFMSKVLLFCGSQTTLSAKSFACTCLIWRMYGRRMVQFMLWRTLAQWIISRVRDKTVL